MASTPPRAPSAFAQCNLDETVKTNWPILASVFAPYRLSLEYLAPERRTDDHCIMISADWRYATVLGKISIDYFAQPASYTAMCLHPSLDFTGETHPSIEAAAAELIEQLHAYDLIPVAG